GSRRGLAFRHRRIPRVDDLHAAILVGEGIVLVLELLLAEADGRQMIAVDMIGLDQEILDRIGAPMRQREILGVAALGVGMTSDENRTAGKLRIAESLAELIERRPCFGENVG